MLSEKISEILGFLTIILLVLGVFGAIFFFSNTKNNVLTEEPLEIEEIIEYKVYTNKEYGNVLIEEPLEIEEIIEYKVYTNKEYGFEIKYPYYLFDIKYNTDSFKALFPLESEDVFLEKAFSIQVWEEEYGNDIEYYCNQGIPHTFKVIIGGIDLCETLSYEDVSNNIAIRGFSYFLIHNKKFITFALTLSFCFDKDCVDPSELDIEKERERFRQIISTLRFL